MSEAVRLSRATLRRATPAPRVQLPRVDGAETTVGIVHFGIGAFHRAHQAVFTEDAAAESGEKGWGILGVTGRSDAVVAQLEPQDGLYGVLVKGASETSLRLVGSVLGAVWPGRDSAVVIGAVAAPTTRMATLTITEKGYLRAPGGGIDLSNDAVAHDLELIDSELADEPSVGQSRTPMGLLVRGLARRHRAGGEPFAVVSCDNLVNNGAVARELVFSLVDALPGAVSSTDARAAFRAWLEQSVSFPSTMVDRITPATTERERDEAAALLGLRDEALVVAEPFSQWVIEDDFAGGRPRWELAGAILTDDVAPYELVKLRVLNATHSLLAWLGALAGHETIAQAVADERMRGLALEVINDDILPTLTAPDGFDLAQYRDSVLERFANPNLEHTTLQVAMDGSQKLPNRVLGTVADRLAVGEVPRGLALVVAAWITFIAAAADSESTLDDPLAAELLYAVGTMSSLRAEPAAVVARVLAIDSVFPRGVRESKPFAAAIVEQLTAVADFMPPGS